MASLDLPDDVGYIQDLIDKWQEEYAYVHTPGGDRCVDEFHIDLGYVCAELKKWIEVSQWQLCERDNDSARSNARGRMAARDHIVNDGFGTVTDRLGHH